MKCIMHTHKKFQVHIKRANDNADNKNITDKMQNVHAKVTNKGKHK